MYNPKFKYTPINRSSVNGQRLYTTPDNEKLASVTTILDATKTEESKKALQEWRSRVGTKKAQEITTEAASRGTRMHKFLEDYVKQGKITEPGSNPYSMQSHTMAQLIIESGLTYCEEFWGIEVPLYFPKVYAGTTDCVGIHKGIPCILDFKQTNKLKKREWIDDYFMQLCAYSEAHNEVHGTKINQGIIMMCVKPEINDKGNIVSKPVYQEFILEGTEFEKYRSMWWCRVEQFYTANM